MEVWKPVKGFEGLYDISDQGCVRNTRNRYLLKLQNSGNGYFKVQLCKKGKVYRVWVHRLVAEAFVPNPQQFPVVDHIDCNKRNNLASNLEWVTQKENSRRAYSKGLVPNFQRFYGEQHPNHVLNEKQVSEIKAAYQTGLISQRQLARMYGVSQTTIKMIVNNQTWKEVL